MMSNEIAPLDADERLLPGMLLWEETADGHFDEFKVCYADDITCLLQDRNGGEIIVAGEEMRRRRFYKRVAGKPLF